MQEVKYPKKDEWKKLAKRPVSNQKAINKKVKPILKAVRKKGDKALLALTAKFDGVELSALQVTKKEIEAAVKKVNPKLKKAIKVAEENIKKFHAAQIEKETVVETSQGVNCWRRSTAIEKVGLYIPGGSAPLFSTVLMLAIPAQLAGCKEVILCTPPNKEEAIHPAILYAADLCGVHAIYKIGGAQAIAAMAYGTKTIPQVSKIFGPGNQYVTAAKQIINNKGIAIDMPAGPSEVAVIADKTANPVFVAADLIAQAEHGSDSQVILLTDSEKLIDDVQEALYVQLKALPRAMTAIDTLENSHSILFKSIDEAMAFSNFYAPEHLIISCKNYQDLGEKVVNAGSVFLGHYTPESLGDYASGTNHTLPTNGFAKAYSGVSIDSFVKKITYQEVSKKGLKVLGPSVEIMAKAEELEGHANAVTLRLKELSNK
ncbi:MAG: histidinol dehydrogenase [Chitinophagales bacterium]